MKSGFFFWFIIMCVAYILYGVIYAEQNYAEQVGLTHYYHVCYEGCLANFEIGDGAVEASKLYPELKYTTVEDYMKRYL